MKKIFLFLLFFIGIPTAHATVFIGSITTEEEIPLPGIDLQVKTENNSFTICSGESDYDGLIRLECELEKEKKYNLFVFGKYHSQVTSEPEIQTIGIYEYNDIKIGFYSKNKKISIFSEEYKKIEENLFWETYGPTQGFTYNPDDYFLFDILFLCKDARFSPKRINYTLSASGSIIDRGNNSNIRAISIEKGQTVYYTLQYQDDSVIREISFYPEKNTHIVYLENCTGENSNIRTDNIVYARTSEEDGIAVDTTDLEKEPGVILDSDIKVIEKKEEVVIPQPLDPNYFNDIPMKKQNPYILIALLSILLGILLYFSFRTYQKKYKIK